MFSGNGADCPVLKNRTSLSQRGTSLDLNTFGEGVTHDLLLRHVGMNLDLVDGRLDTGVCQQFVHVMRVEVTYSDGADLPCIDILLHDFPCLLDLSGYRPMNQHQIDIRSPECFDRPVERLAHLAATHGIGSDFRSDEHLAPVDTALPDTFTHFCLVRIIFGGIDQTPAFPYRFRHAFSTALDRNTQCAVSQNRHPYAVVKRRIIHDRVGIRYRTPGCQNIRFPQ